MVKNILKMFKSDSGKDIEFIRVSTLACYYYCSVKARCQAMGVDSPNNEAFAIGKKIHDGITASRQPSQYELALEDYLKTCMVNVDAGEGSTGIRDAENQVLMRGWYDGGVVIGQILTHGLDDFEVNEKREVTVIEYKTTKSKRIDNYKVCTALFQLKLYWWILTPLLNQAGYKIVRGKIVYLDRTGKFIDERIIRIDESDQYSVENWQDDWYVYNTRKLESDITKIIEQFRHPENLIAPARWKCFRCEDVFKKLCPFQRGAQ